MTNLSSSLGKVPEKYFHSLTKIFHFWKSSFPLFLLLFLIWTQTSNSTKALFGRLLFCFQIIYPLLLAFLLISLWLPSLNPSSNLNQCVLNFLLRTIIEKYLFFVSFLHSLTHSFFLFLFHSLLPNPLFSFIVILSKSHKGVIEDRSLLEDMDAALMSSQSMELGTNRLSDTHQMGSWKTYQLM